MKENKKIQEFEQAIATSYASKKGMYKVILEIFGSVENCLNLHSLRDKDRTKEDESKFEKLETEYTERYGLEFPDELYDEVAFDEKYALQMDYWATLDDVLRDYKKIVKGEN